MHEFLKGFSKVNLFTSLLQFVWIWPVRIEKYKYDKQFNNIKFKLSSLPKMKLLFVFENTKIRTLETAGNMANKLPENSRH